MSDNDYDSSLQDDNVGISRAIVSSEELKIIFDNLSNSLLEKISQECDEQSKHQSSQIQNLISNWTQNIATKTQEIIKETLLTTPEGDSLSLAITESNDRRSKIIQDIKEAHTRQLQVLKTAITEERKEAALAQQVFEQTLRTKYDNLVIALQEKVKDEQEARLHRAIEDLERNAKLESERAKQSLELQQSADIALSAKFKNIVGDLRKSWEEEEIQRAKFLEERLRGHYSAVLEHMEAQLHMALQLQDAADKRWMEDVQERNKQHIETMRAFEDKCTRLYETRLREYVHKTDEMMNQYESQLLQTGTTLALERNKYESKQRRLKVACAKWKADYQRILHDKYRVMIDEIEQRYVREIEDLLQDTTVLKKAITPKQAEILETELSILSQENSKSTKTAQTKKTNGVKASTLISDLESSWTELNTPFSDRIEMLTSILDDAEVNPEMSAKYEQIMKKLSARLPIAQALSRKQYLEYKIKLTSRADSGKGDGFPHQTELNAELRELQRYLSDALVKYENYYGESFHRQDSTPLSPGRSSSPTSMGALAVSQISQQRSFDAGGNNTSDQIQMSSQQQRGAQTAPNAASIGGGRRESSYSNTNSLSPGPETINFIDVNTRSSISSGQAGGGVSPYNQPQSHASQAKGNFTSSPVYKKVVSSDGGAIKSRYILPNSFSQNKK